MQKNGHNDATEMQIIGKKDEKNARALAYIKYFL